MANIELLAEVNAKLDLITTIRTQMQGDLQRGLISPEALHSLNCAEESATKSRDLIKDEATGDLLKNAIYLFGRTCAHLAIFHHLKPKKEKPDERSTEGDSTTPGRQATKA
jgi:hypothetical protein